MISAYKHVQWQRLLSCQYNALCWVEELAVSKRLGARDTLRRILAQSGIAESARDDAIESLYTHAQVVLHFHPDRLSVKRHSVAEGLLQEGVYRSQFETGLSNGSLTAFAGGERDLWEKRIFGGAYHVAGISGCDRPKYGALELMYHPDGASPRFGSCYFVLNAKVTKRCSFTFGGSQSDLVLEQSGTITAMDCVMAALLTEVEKGEGALGVNELTVSSLLSQLRHGLSKPFLEPATRPLGRALDSFVEGQVHGTINLSEDVVRLVADPSFREGCIGEILKEICVKYGIELNWHPGFTLPVADVSDDFRGPTMPVLARRIAGEGILNVEMIGEAAASLHLQPELWRDWGSHRETLQHLKQLWHVLVAYGSPADSTSHNIEFNQ